MWFHSHGFGNLSESMAEQVVAFVYEQVPLASPRTLTNDEKSDAREIFEGKLENRRACQHCAGIHHTVAGMAFERQPCPRVKAIEWHPDRDNIVKVEYWPNGEWEADILFPHEVYGDGEETE